MARRAAGVAMALAVLAGCAGGRDDVGFTAARTGAELAVQAALVMLPGQSEPIRLAAAPPGGAERLPVVVYAHGCAGLDARAAATLRLLAAHGYAAVAPDHAARPDARPGCALRAGEAQVERRLEETRLALARVRDLPFVDGRRVFLVGHSLGPGTTALWPVEGVTAAAVLGQPCGGPDGTGMAATVPLLRLADRRLPGGADPAREPQCGEMAMQGGLGVTFGGGAGRGHPDPRGALLRFLAGGPLPG